jgi:hypothetical protein
MYEINIEPVEKPKSKIEKSRELLDTMLDVMSSIENMDDAGFVLRMKLLNNVEFLVDELMDLHQHEK